ncbi:hypothetical protein GLAREA_12729 [Glarea lozoyensis ATCC 20868]|uniref:2EXR domain-containing protein n=1 Tax=Glarea lozoyensis (strain ATCC 20868 / MF5171) TaxID=1116229 RepID=S3DHC4_GLAL2|nr:uncharacterized protein GLAREA_12729 [Glarea lozoyensis ATCC 20868]EPE31426.1 hypothetical protein GLAREA_12729 [Glarea lozoyensis ATCC 20868]
MRTEENKRNISSKITVEQSSAILPHLSPPRFSWESNQNAVRAAPKATTSEARFPKFSNLPTELRLKIWKYALPKGQYVIPLALGRRRSQTKYKFPYILHVKQEARQTALESYILLFNNSFFAFRMYCNPDRDVLVLGDPEVQSAIRSIIQFGPSESVMLLRRMKCLGIDDAMIMLENLFYNIRPEHTPAAPVVPFADVFEKPTTSIWVPHRFVTW